MGGREEAEGIFRRVIAAAASDFYRVRWGNATAFDSLPSIAREDFIAAPLPKRRYKDDSSFVKIVRDQSGQFLSEWSFDDIAKEGLGVHCMRPLVYMSDPYEAIQWSLWCYENGILPLIGEADPDITASAAEQYRIDALITDGKAILKLRGALSALPKKLGSITVIDSSFDSSVLAEFSPYADTVRLVFAIPETGALADSPLSTRPQFSALPGCLFENIDDELVVTKFRDLVTPIIRYQVPSELFPFSVAASNHGA